MAKQKTSKKAPAAAKKAPAAAKKAPAAAKKAPAAAKKAPAAPQKKGVAAKPKGVAAKPKGKSSATRRKSAPIALSTEEKQRMLKPLTGFGDLIERLVTTWKGHGSKVKVPGLTPARLASLLRTAGRASKREEAVRTALEARLQPLADARLRAEHDVWKSALDLHAMVKTAARTDPAIAAPFDFFADAMTRRRAGAAPATPTDEVAAKPA